MKRFITLFFFLGLFVASVAQTKREWMNYADIAFNKGDYNNAVTYYLKVVNKETPFDITHPYVIKPYVKGVTQDKTTKSLRIFKKQLLPEQTQDSVTLIKDTTQLIEFANYYYKYAVHQIASCYRFNHDYKNAETWYQQSLQINLAEYPFDCYGYGDALMKNKKYPAANLQFETALAFAIEKNDTAMINLSKSKIAGCYLAIDPKSVQNGIVVTELDSIFNGGVSSFAVNYFGEERKLLFASAREAIVSNKKHKAVFTSDIYLLDKTENSDSPFKKMVGPINTNRNEGAGFLTADGNRFFFTRWLTNNTNECAIYFSRLFNGEWLPSQKMNEKVNLPGYKSSDPCVVPDGSIIYYASNRPGGFGKMDIWYENIDDEGRTYGEPINMGPLFNTADDESSPFFHVGTSTLYFSSDGHPGFGGLDILKSSFNASDSIWSMPKNLGAPINSNYDDSYFILDESQELGYLTSDRKECDLCDGGSCFKIYSVSKERNIFDLSGVVYNSETNEVIPNATITFKDIRSDWEPFVISTDAAGAYSYLLKEGVELFIKVQKNNFASDAGTIITRSLTESKHFERDFFLVPATNVVEANK